MDAGAQRLHIVDLDGAFAGVPQNATAIGEICHAHPQLPVQVGGGIRDVDTATEVGKLVGSRAKDAGISQVVFDRGGFQYHGRVKALAEGARESGLEF